ncbi:hypothetical protein OSB04_un001122 [Centaurea solstitialis]|uniref:Integrase catalytic domain-containing protein n=1 Tax=Centaurea solstitialis TaxID=347529 RepID=A0AA38SMB3_9ASTR|nr:hypothetical protein OSB04_un001122 [Centaurea solstitialis]
MADHKLHPAVTVSNIRTFVPITLDNEAADYNTWSELFRIHCTAFLVADHLEPRRPSPTATPSTDKEKQSASPHADSWERLDAIVLQWIYGTISTGLLKTVIKKSTTAYDAWKAIENLFQDNKATRALFLKQKFANTRLEIFSSMHAYCQEIKVLADQLNNVDAPVDEQDLVLQTIAGLTEQYETVGTILQNTKPLPSFFEVRSQLCMNETTKANQALHSSQQAATALHVQSQTRSFSANPNTTASQTTSDTTRGRGRSRGRGRGRSSTSQPTRSRGQPNYPAQSQHPYIIFPNNWATTQWASLLNNTYSPQSNQTPPCPYPSTPRPNGSHGILGPRSAQAHMATYSPTPTDIAQALYTLSMSQPSDPVAYMDTGASGHMEQPGMTSPFIFNTCTNKQIVVGNGTTIPVIGQGNKTLPPPFPPLKLNNILYAPNLIKNLISVRRLTTDNLLSIEFDPFGFLVKDLKTKEPILRCNSSGDLYPLTTNFIKPPSKPIALAAVTQDRWHQRLGHPGKSLLHSLKSSSFIDFSKPNNTLCQSCVFGKSVKLPFYDSMNKTHLPFDIIHSNLWTSPVLSTGGHRYYILFLDDLTDFLWTYPLTNKSQVYNTFTNFHNHIHTQFERKIKQFQCDNGTEYTNNNFKQFCHINGMHFRFSCPHTSSQNGKAERKIRTINNMIRTLLSQASLPPSFWHHALETATYLLNILPKKTHKFLSPSTLLYNVLPTYTHLRVFGCLCYPTTPSTTINKLTNRSKPCVFLGYPSNHRGYKCFDISNNQIFISRHVQFEESIYPFSIQHSNTTLDYTFLSPPFNPLLWDNVRSSKPTAPPNAPHPTSLGPTPTGPTASDQPSPSPHQPSRTASVTPR